MDKPTEPRSLRLAPLWLAAIVLILAPLPVVGSTTRGDSEVSALLARPLTADVAVRIARLRQGRLHAAAFGVEAAQARRRQAGLLPNPELKVDLRRPGESRDAPQADVEVEFDLGHVLTLPIRRSIADAEVDVARHVADRSMVELEHAVRIAFYSVQSSERRWQNAVVALETTVAARDAARALLAAGNMTAAEAGYHEAASEVMRAEADRLELDYYDAREQMQQLLGLHGAETAWQAEPLNEALPDEPPDIADVESRAIASNLELARFRAEISSLARTKRLNRIDGWLPGLAVDMHAERDETEWEVGGGVRVHVPLFDRRQGEIAALEADLRGLESRFRAAAVDLRSQARAARNHAVSTHARARHWRERVLPAQQNVVAEALLQHNAMQVDVFELLEAKRAEVEAERATSDAHFDALIARCVLEAFLDGAPIGLRTAAQETPRLSANRSSGGH